MESSPHPKKLRINDESSLVIKEDEFQEIVKRIKEKNSPEKKHVDDEDGHYLVEQEKMFLKKDERVIRSLEEIDTSYAYNMELDATLFKEISVSLFKCFVHFVFHLRNKATMDELFSRPGKTLQLGLTCFQGKVLRNDHEFQAYAVVAIEIFNRICEGDMNLKLLRLIKVNTGSIGSFVVFLTFSAVDLISGKSGIYQAALHSDHCFKLALFRDYSNDKILAFLSLTGAEEYWASLQSLEEYIVQEFQKYDESDL